MSDIFQMDSPEEQYARGYQQPTASTSTESSPILLEYAPKQAALHPGIHSWLAAHGSSYLPHDQPRGSSPRRARPVHHARSFALSTSSNSSSSDADSDSSDSDEEDAIFLQPRRHLSRQGSAMTSPVSQPAPAAPTIQKKSNSASHHHFHLTAQRPALPVVDLSSASGHVELDLDFVPQLDKSHWSDDESDVTYSDADESEDDEETNDPDGLWALHPDELDVPALVDDEEGNPASTSTRSIPIPLAPTAAAGVGRLRAACYDVESPPTRRKSMDGQSFWTPWMDRYLADAAAVAQAAR